MLCSVELSMKRVLLPRGQIHTVKILVCLCRVLIIGISYSYQMDQSIVRFKGCWVDLFIFIQILIEFSVSKQWRP